ncbi:MAG: glycyl-radical enzyme activating protein [Desulfobulbaceae bacterium]|nr:glycyl-radical enzyme activating protein [Desulfobulbaceae bacterium]
MKTSFVRDGLPLIVDVKRHSLEDGPGIRSVVFFKGCPLRCVFCHNPEAQEKVQEIAFTEKECIFCGECVEVCPLKAINLESLEIIDRERCNSCGMCVDACPGKGLRRVGTYYEVEELAELLLRDRAFYKHSHGGITLSGGECTLYPEYVEALLKFLKPLGIHVVVETCGFFSYKTFSRKILPYVDLVYYDLKFADPAVHKKYTGRSNRRILENFQSLIREERVKVIPRIPLVPEITATKENLTAIASFLKTEGIKDAVLLPYNPMGLGKYGIIGNPRPPLPEHFMSQEEEKALEKMFNLILRQTK